MIGDRIRLARRKAGFSLRDLSAAIQGRVTAEAIGKYERGEDSAQLGGADGARQGAGCVSCVPARRARALS